MVKLNVRNFRSKAGQNFKSEFARDKKMDRKDGEIDGCWWLGGRDPNILGNARDSQGKALTVHWGDKKNARSWWLLMNSSNWIIIIMYINIHIK